MTDYLATVRGTLVTASLKEIFVFTIPGIATSDQSTAATAVKNAFATAWAGAPTIAGLLPTTTAFTEVTCAEIINKSTGTLKAASHVPFAPVLNGSGTITLPSQLAVCVSTAGGSKPNGIPYRGRFYLPGPAGGALVSGTGLISTSATWSGWAKAFFLAMIANSYVPAVWSRKDASMSIITQLRVGATVDTIRTRRNELAEAYSVQTIP
jgi:hypothetical protein